MTSRLKGIKMEQSKILSSYKFDDGTLAEMVYDRNKRQTFFVVSKKEKGNEECEITYMDSLETPDGEIKPFSPTDSILTLNLVRFANDVENYLSIGDLYGQVKHYIRKYVSLPEDFLNVATVYVFYTWLYDLFPIAPYLRVLGGHGTGKTRFLSVVGALCYKPIMVGGSTSTSAIFRIIDHIKGTLVFDETDFQNSEMWSEMIKVLNGGHDKTFPVMKMEGEKNGGFKHKVFHVFGPKVLASRERYSDIALESRAVSQRLYPSSNFPIILGDEAESLAAFIRRQLLMFRFKNYAEASSSEVVLEQIKAPRVKQTFMALINTASLINESVVESVMAYAVKMDMENSSNMSSTPQADVVLCIIELLIDTELITRLNGKLHMKVIAEKYNQRFYEDNNDKLERIGRGDGTGFVIPNYKVSAKKIGTLIHKIGIRTERDSEGIFIPPTEAQRIHAIKNHFGITEEMIKKVEPIDSNRLAESEF